MHSVDIDDVTGNITDILFPNLGIILKKVGNQISLFGIDIKYYGIVIALAFIMGYILAVREAKRTNQNTENYLDLILALIVPVILGARIYYILFRLDDYIVKGSIKETLLGMINIRNGGLAIYGGVIAGIIVGIIFTRVKKMNFWLTADTAAFGLLIGQIIGRWGNFFNREAFGGYTNCKFAMAIPVDYFKSKGSYYGLVNSGIISSQMLENTKTLNGLECITVHPTFLYESLWNLLLLILLYLLRKYKKFDGQLALTYVMGYGFGRFLIESLRSDSLMIGGVLKVSQLLGLICFIAGAGALLYMSLKKKGSKVEEVPEEKTE
jgi:phosphatidylglycerol:prolipoprotein diacylglycerol transferase